MIVNFLPSDSLGDTVEGSLNERYEAAYLHEDDEVEEAV